MGTNNYWDTQKVEGRMWQEVRYKKNGMVWGQEEGPTVPYACNFFKSKGIKKVLIIGCGYGRECIYISKYGFDVVGIDTSLQGIELAREWAKKEDLKNVSFNIGNALELLIDNETFDAVFTHKVFHQFSGIDREKMLEEIYRVLKPKGIVILSDLSENDPDYDNGVQIEEHTFERHGRPYRPIHYMSANRLEEFNRFNILDVQEIEIQEAHPGEDVTHKHYFLRVTGEKSE